MRFCVLRWNVDIEDRHFLSHLCEFRTRSDFSINNNYRSGSDNLVEVSHLDLLPCDIGYHILIDVHSLLPFKQSSTRVLSPQPSVQFH
jgi:hypothetical protein